MTNLTIAESFSSSIILRFVPISHSNTMTPQGKATMVQLKPLTWLPGNLSNLECEKSSLGISVIVTLASEAGPRNNIALESWDPSPSHWNHRQVFQEIVLHGYHGLKDGMLDGFWSTSSREYDILSSIGQPFLPLLLLTCFCSIIGSSTGFLPLLSQILK
jgi:hypothetical protein